MDNDNTILREVIGILMDTSTLVGGQVDSGSHRIMDYLKEIKEDTSILVAGGGGGGGEGGGGSGSDSYATTQQIIDLFT